MTHVTYSQQQLHLKSLAQLKRTYSEIGCTLEVRDRRRRDAWISAFVEDVGAAIAFHQAAQLQKIARPTKDEQEIAQGEFDQYIADQAEAVAPEPLTTVEINFYHHEVYCGKELIAYITYDHGEFVTQPWLVMVNGEEKFRDTTLARCHRFIYWHHKDGTLNLFALTEVPEVPAITEISFYDQEALVNGELVASISFDDKNHENLYWRVLVNDIEIFRDITPARCHSYIKQQYQQGTLPVQEPFEEPCTIGNEVMVRIFNDYEKCGLQLLEDGNYRDDVKLGSVGFTDGNWWLIGASSVQQHKVACDSVDGAVQLLSVAEVPPISYEELLDREFDQLTADEWLLVMESEPIRELVAA
ncbi:MULTISPECIES: hypothetical protein [Nostoc]|uniref:Uncharacterized protein n=1 Tax=Nostoc paludosum FACHB-159 TaxID=2692908 RepID=A0ABR8KP50_9NOSO|nr:MULTISPECIES: hypothetical protein [Nostoc]MBD2683267.1 hypothetical protein [Nostoc sp. FACHB-857]MBD2739582.1 hypothetical protein [Nostoc paludosum FACHB-159]